MAMTEIFIGIISILVFVIIQVGFKKLVLPLLRKKRYRGYNISGKWEVYYNGLESYSAILDLDQVGKNIFGQSIVMENTSRQKVDRKYTYNGSILNNSIILTFEDLGNPNLFGGAMVFYISDSDAVTMKGTTIYYKPESNEIRKVDAILLKKGTSKDFLKILESKNSLLNNNQTNKSKFKSLLADGEIEIVIEEMLVQFSDRPKVVDDLIIIKSRFKRLASEKLTGTANRNDLELGNNNIIKSLLAILESNM